MKILFILPEIGSFCVWHQGIAILSAVLKKEKHKVDLIELDKYDTSLIANKIIGFEPEVIIISTNSHMFTYTRRIARFIKYNFRLPVFVGGIHTILNPECINKLEVNGICIGEGEQALVELVEKIENKEDYTDTPNFWFKKDNKIIKNISKYFTEDLNTLPSPDYTIFKYFKDKTIQIIPRFIFSRGCPFQCSYCCNYSLRETFSKLGKYVRFLTVDKAIEQIKEMDKNYIFDHFIIDDDTVTLDKKWIIEFSQKVKKLNKTFSCNVRVETIDREILTRLQYAGCNMISIGIESGDEELRKDVLDRHMTNKQIIKIFKIAREIGLKTSSFNMIGVPKETIETIQKTIDLNIIIKPDKLQVTIFYPYENTKLGDYCIKHKLIDSKSDNYFRESVLNLDTISKKELLKARRYFRYNIYKKYDFKKAILSLLIDSKLYEIIQKSFIFEILMKIADKFNLYQAMP